MPGSWSGVQNSRSHQLLYPFLITCLITGYLLLQPRDSDGLNQTQYELIDLKDKLTDIKAPSSGGAMAPRLTVAAGKLYMSWLEPDSTTKGEKNWHLKWSEWQDGQWSPAGTITSSTHFFINWADFPSMFATSPDTLYAHWLEKNPDTKSSYAYDVQLARSTDAGQHWQALGRIRKDLPAHEKNYDGFVSFVEENGKARAFWIDGRAHDSKDLMSLRSVLVGDTIGTEHVLDDNVCSCCGTSAVSGSKGSTIFYRNRTNEEIRDISYVSSKNAQWSSPQILSADNWHISGCPVNGPQAAIKHDHIAVASFSGANDQASVRLSWSEDNGQSFGSPIEIDTLSPKGPLGRVDVVMPDTQRAIVSWLGQDSNGQAVLYLRLINTDGQLSQYFQVIKLNADRATGFPQLALLGETLFIAWTEVSKQGKDVSGKGLRLVKINIAELAFL